MRAPEALTQTLVIANPASGGGSSPERLAALERELAARIGAREFVQTTGTGAAGELAVKAARAGVSRIVVAGGDGTFGEVVDGLLSADLASRVALGILPLGRGCDLARTLGVSRKLDAAIAALAAGRERRIDAGRIEYGSVVRHFANVASGGVPADVVRRMNRPSKLAAALGATPAFALAAIRALAAYRPIRTRLVVDGACVLDEPLALIVVANGCYFGAGMRVAPGALLDDGCFEIVTIKGQSRPRLISSFPSLYRGNHLTRSYVRVFSGRRVEIAAEPGDLALEADGEELGSAPARFEILPGAVRVFGSPG